MEPTVDFSLELDMSSQTHVPKMTVLLSLPDFLISLFHLGGLRQKQSKLEALPGTGRGRVLTVQTRDAHKDRGSLPGQQTATECHDTEAHSSSRSGTSIA